MGWHTLYTLFYLQTIKILLRKQHEALEVPLKLQEEYEDEYLMGMSKYILVSTNAQRVETNKVPASFGR